MASRFLTAEHPDHGTLWAAIDECAHHLTGRVAERRFAAFLAPFRSEEEAMGALLAAGGVLDVKRAAEPRRRDA